jgi:hypothetical protein
MLDCKTNTFKCHPNSKISVDTFVKNGGDLKKLSVIEKKMKVNFNGPYNYKNMYFEEVVKRDVRTNQFYLERTTLDHI